MKMYCIVSKESLGRMNGIRGKLMNQAGHAFLHSWWDAHDRFPVYSEPYRNNQAAVKIVLVCETDKEMLDLYENYYNICGVTKVIDAGKTVFKGPTLTCVGIGPIRTTDIGDDLKDLKVLI